MTYRPSPEGRAIYEEFEQGPTGGPALIAYLCPAGRPTLGYGHTEGVRLGDTLPSKVAAEMLLDEDIAKYTAEVRRYLDGAPTGQHELEALGSLNFNIGGGLFATSTALRLHKKGDKAGAAKAIELFNKATVGGQLVVMPGLVRRRAAEKTLYLTPDQKSDTPTVQPMPQVVAPEPPVSSSKTVIAGGVSVAAGAATVADQINQVTPIVESITTAGASLHNLLKLGGLALSVIALCAVGYMLWRYIQKRRAGDVVST